MLKLKRIELLGFKSFYERSEIRVDDSGVTAVVGPNGCGKSNISDAVAWVLGEQRARSLRGDRMEDVIFSGTGRRSPLGMAEVTLSLIDESPGEASSGNGTSGNGTSGNGHSAPPPGPAELTVQRRLYRSGESQYLINGRACRLRDVQDVFLGTGLGPNSYAIIEQGRVGQLLSARPSDRRTLIEEAAGVTRFKAKRKLAESRLQAAEKNLARVNDILAEVERQRNSLRRQASKARRYREVKKRLREVLSGVFSTRAEMLLAGQDRVAAALGNLSREGHELESEIADLDRGVHEARTGLETQEKRLEDARTRQVDGKLELEKVQQRIERLKDQVRALDQREQDLVEEKDRVRQALDRRRSEIAEAGERLSQAERNAEDLEQKLSEDQKVLGDLRRERAEEEQAVEALRDQRFEAVGREAQIRNELSGKEELLERIEAEVVGKRAEEREARDAVEMSEQALRSARAEQEAKREEVGRLQAEHATLAARHDSLRQEHEKSQAEAREARSEEEGIRHRLETMRDLSLEKAYGTESVQQFFSEARGAPWAPMGILADFVEVDGDHESIVEDLLHAELQYVVVRDLRHAREALSVVRGTVRGRLDFFVAESTGRSRRVSEVVPGATPIAEIVRFGNGLESLEGLVADAYLVDDLDEAWRYSRLHPDCRFVARTGEVVFDGVISWGERQNHGPLSLKREMRDLDRRMEVARVRSEEVGKRVVSLKDRCDSLGEVLEQTELRRQEAEKETLGMDHALRGLGAELDRAGQRVRLVAGEVERLEQERREVERALGESQVELRAAEERKASIDAEMGLRVERSGELGERAEVHAQAVADLSSQLAVLNERQESLRRDLSGLKSHLSDLDERHQWAEDQIEGTSDERARTRESITESESRLEELGRHVAELDDVIRAEGARLEELRREMRVAEAEWDRARERLDSWKDRNNELEIEKAQIASDVTHLVSLCFSELGESLESVCLDSFETLTEEELREHDREHEELRRKIDSMGNVNMMAVEEYEEADQRFEFLSVQRQDLLDSIRDTSQAIDEIDAVCSRQFREAFLAINERFAQSFAELFGGGHGELRLIDEADVSDAGIEIVAQPPGKKLQNVLLLSGGEKAMAALALVIALFRYKPSPFCVLDEVDAPLDDANVDRFANLIRGMSDGTQFIVITHSKRTMETANQLYGVTMEEPGVSKVVSVRLN